MEARVSINRLCRGCMNVLDSADSACAFCGFDKNEYTYIKEHLRLDCILKGKYLVGKCIRETDMEKTYIGWNLSYDTKVVIKEYFSKELMEREDHESGRVISKKNISAEIVKKNITKFITQAELMAFDLDKKINVTETFQENGTGYYVAECVKRGTEDADAEVESIADYEVVKPADYIEYKSAFVEQEEAFVNKNLGQAYHVQPARSENKGTVVKSIAPGVLQGASVSYQKTTRTKNSGVRYIDIHVEDEDDYLANETQEPVTISFTDDKEERQVNDGVKMSSSQGIVDKVKEFVLEHKGVSVGAAAGIVCLGIIIAVVSGGKGDENNKIANNSPTAVVTATGGQNSGQNQVPQEEPSGGEQTESEQTVAPTIDPELFNQAFVFSEVGGTLEQAVCGCLGKKAEELTIGDVQSVKILDLKGTGLTDITDLDKFIGLVELDISDNPIESVDVLSNLPELTRLNITGCGLTDVNSLNSSPKLAYVNATGCKELVEQLTEIDFVAGRRDKIDVQFIYSREDMNYENWSIWVWTTSDPGGEYKFEVGADGTAMAMNDYLLSAKNDIGFKLKKGEWDNADDSDRNVVCQINKPGTLVKIYIQDGKEDVTVEYVQAE